MLKEGREYVSQLASLCAWDYDGAYSHVSENFLMYLLHLSLQTNEGVLISKTIHAPKGPDYAYADAYNEPLHDGLEFKLIEKRNGWAHIELTDGRRSWILTQDAQFIGGTFNDAQ